MKKQWKQIGREILFGLPVAAGVILIIPALAGILDGRGWASAGWLALSVALLIAPVYVEDKLVERQEMKQEGGDDDAVYSAGAGSDPAGR